MSSFKVLLVDDHPVVRSGLSQIINQNERLQVSGEAGNLEECLQQIEQNMPDIMLLDLSLGDESGFDVLETVKANTPELKVLVLSMHDESQFASRALSLGASGYLMKEVATEEVVNAILVVMEGGEYLSESFKASREKAMAAGELTESQLLSKREIEVFEMVGNGVTTRDIANKLNLSIKTVEAHKSNIKAKLNLANATELAHRAFKWVEKNKVV